MRVIIVGAGNVGQAIARELLANDHEVLLIDRDPAAIQVTQVPNASCLLADACEMTTLTQASLQTADVVVAAAGEDKVNLVVSLLAKTEYGVPRTIARVNNPTNEWMFDASWGVDVAVSTPKLITALVEEAVETGDLVTIFSFQHTTASLVELTLPADSAVVGRRVGAIAWPPDTAPVAIIRNDRPLAPSKDDVLEAADDVMIMTTVESEPALRALLVPASPS